MARNKALGGQVYLSYAEREEILELLELNETHLREEIAYYERQKAWKKSDVPRLVEAAQNVDMRLPMSEIVHVKQAPDKMRQNIQGDVDEIVRLQKKLDTQRHLAEKLYR